MKGVGDVTETHAGYALFTTLPRNTPSSECRWYRIYLFCWCEHFVRISFHLIIWSNRRFRIPRSRGYVNKGLARICYPCQNRKTKQEINRSRYYFLKNVSITCLNAFSTSKGSCWIESGWRMKALNKVKKSSGKLT